MIRNLARTNNMEDYFAAADKHFFDAELLLSQNPSRLANASHLYGVAFECAVKTIIQDNRPPSSHGSVVWGHIHEAKLKQQFIVSNAARNNALLQNQVTAALSNFANWNINQRYCANLDVQFTALRLNSEQHGAKEVIQLRDRWIQGVM